MLPRIIFPFQRGKFFIFNFTRENRELDNIDLSNPEEFSRYIENKLIGYDFGIGRYNEDRCIYDHSEVFNGERTIHLGIDIFVSSGIEIFCPIDGIVHSFQNNSAKGDYGPTIIIEHENFYTLYGHLSLDSLNVRIGQRVLAGSVIGKVGDTTINGEWPTHLHFQMIKDMKNRMGDFPGVCSLKERDNFLRLCPDPNLILNLPKHI